MAVPFGLTCSRWCCGNDGESEATEDKNTPFETELLAPFHRGLDLKVVEVDERFTNEGGELGDEKIERRGLLMMKSGTDTT